MAAVLASFTVGLTEICGDRPAGRAGGRPGLRLDQLLMRCAGLSRRQARLCISLGRVRIDGRTARIIARRPPVGASVDWQLPDELTRQGVEPPRRGGRPAEQGGGLGGAIAARTAPPASLEIIHLDRDLVVVNKPAGLLSEPDRFGSPSVLCRLAARLEALGEDASLWLVHRLDAGTSGVMVLARRPQAARLLSAAFAARQVEKVYLALAAGTLAGPCTVAAPIARLRGTKHAVSSAGKPALTLLSPRQTAPAAVLPGTRDGAAPVPSSRPGDPWPALRRQPGSQLVEARPRSGRTHQIRVHLSALGCPIVGDGLYGGLRRTSAGARGLGARGVARPMLHACRLALKHPRDGRPVQWSAPLPADFSSCAAALGLRLPAATDVATEP